MAGESIVACKAKGAGFVIDFGKDGILKNPRSETDRNGKFEIVIDRSMLGEEQKMTLLYRSRMLHDNRHNAPLVFKVDKEARKIDLDKAIGPIIVKPIIFK